jgi:hypothetical protein
MQIDIASVHSGPNKRITLHCIKKTNIALYLADIYYLPLKFLQALRRFFSGESAQYTFSTSFI